MQLKSKKKMLGASVFSVFLLLAMAATAGAGTIETLCTSAAWTNSTADPTMVVPPNPGWAPAFACPTPSGWISYEQSGDPSLPGYVSPPNGTIVDFYDTLSLSSAPTNATLNFGADDTGQVWINGVKVVDFATGVGNTYNTCSDFAPGCDSATEILGMNVTSYLTSGVNNIELVDSQIKGSSSGVDATIMATTSTVITPEPATFGLIGGGLLFLGCFKLGWFKPKLLKRI